VATWDKYLSPTTGFENQLRTGKTFTPRSYCDDPTLGPVALYILKEPVCKLLVTPLSQFTNTTVSWDISQSVSTTSTIDTYDINFGGGGATNVVGASFAGAKTGTVTYTSAGTFTIAATVTDVLGSKSKECKLTIDITADFISLQRCYIGTDDGGLFILTPSGGPTANNTGLTGNHINFRSMRMHPAYRDLPTAQQHLWAATQDGVAFTVDGGANWSVISETTLGIPTNDAGDAPAPTAANPDNIDIGFDPQDQNRVYLVRTTTSPNDRTWLYKTDNYGTTWSNTQVSA